MINQYKVSDWLPTTAKEVKQRGWEQLDVILFSGDAYIDHPSFGASVIGRIIESYGLKVAIVPQPNWRDDLRDFKKMGEPRLFFGITGGNMDSMVNHYTANKRLRSNDAYSPGGKAGFRPDYATSVYSKIVKQLYPNVPVILGGVEASLRRVTHFDYWSNGLKPSILVDSQADLLVYGMGEQAIKEIVRLTRKGVPVSSLTNIPQTAYLNKKDILPTFDKDTKDIILASHNDCLNDKLKYAANFKHVEQESNKKHAARLIQHTNSGTVVINPPYSTMKTKVLDSVYDLPFTYLPHPKYNNKGAIPAYEMIKFSVNLHRGCFGGCSFCTISAHQGKFITSRSEKSILKEIEKISKHKEFKGYLSDLGGPSANMYQMQGRNLDICEKCARPSCIFPQICKNLDTNHNSLTRIYKLVNNLPYIKKAFIGSGVRYDMLYNKNASDKEKESHKKYIEELLSNHISGRIKVAPEHTSDDVLNIMRKPSFKLFYKFKRDFEKINKQKNLKHQIIPYFISSHPGSNIKDMANLAVETKQLNFQLEQVQDFTPTPMTAATVMFYSGVDPYTLKPVFVAKNKEDKQNQRIFFFWYKREYKNKIISLLNNHNQQKLVNDIFSNKGNQLIIAKDKVVLKEDNLHNKKSNNKKNNGFSDLKKHKNNKRKNKRKNYNATQNKQNRKYRK